MDESASWPAVEALLDTLLSLPDAERAAALERSTRDRPELRALVQSLLDHAGGADELLDHPAITALQESPGPRDTSLPATLAVGERIGVYRIIGLIGHGGMGEVYSGQRADGQFEQAVAIKLIRSEANVSIARFQSERQFLADLDHPGIARVFDGGVHSDGRPYMVMELVAGQPLNVWCETHGATLKERLQLFLQVCDAVAYAHAHLIVHRDLKSSNILVTADGRTKLLDFGIATLLRTDALQDASRTAHLSPAHAAPEQLTGAAVTTSTDVYGLGVTLYQLLCGHLPWDVATLPLAAAVRRLLDEPLVPPSSALDDGYPIVSRDLRGNLDAVVAKALRREASARYVDAKALADDLKRHLRGDTVLALEGARLYVIGSFMRRHWLPLSALALVFLALAAGLASTIWQARAARREATRAETEAAKATAVNNFLLDIFKYSSLQNPGGAAARDVTAGKLLDIGAERIRSQLYGQPEVRGELLGTLSSLYDDLGSPDRALELAQEQVDALSRSAGGRAGRSWAEAQIPLANALIHSGRDNDAKRALHSALATLDRLGERDSITRAELLTKLAYADYDGTSSDRVEGLGFLRDAIAMLDRVAPLHAMRGDILQMFGYYAQLDEDYRGAETWKRQYLDFEVQKGYETNAFAIGSALLELGDVQALAGEYAQSETNLREAVRVLTQSAGPKHPSTALAQSRLGEMYYRSGRPAEAQPLLVAALASQQLSPQGQAESTETRKTLGLLELSRGRPAEAEATLNKNLLELSADKDLELRYAVSACALVSVLTAEGKLAHAQELHAHSIEVYRRHLGEGSLGYAGCLLRGAEVELALGGSHLERAADIYRQLRSDWAPKPGLAPEIYALATIGLARSELARGRFESARTESDELMRLISASPDRGFVPDREAQAAQLLGVSWTRLGQPARGETWLRHAIELREKLDYSDGIWLAEAQIDLATALVAQGRLAEARGLLERAADAQRRQPLLAGSYRMELAYAERQLRRADQGNGGPLD